MPRSAHDAGVDFNTIIFLFFIAQFFIPLLQKRMLEARRQAAIRAIEQSRHSRLITMIHRQETMSFLGFPIARYIDIEDSEDVLRAIRLTPPDMPIDSCCTRLADSCSPPSRSRSPSSGVKAR